MRTFLSYWWGPLVVALFALMLLSLSTCMVHAGSYSARSGGFSSFRASPSISRSYSAPSFKPSTPAFKPSTTFVPRSYSTTPAPRAYAPSTTVTHQTTNVYHDGGFGSSGGSGFFTGMLMGNMLSNHQQAAAPVIINGTPPVSGPAVSQAYSPGEQPVYQQPYVQPQRSHFWAWVFVLTLIAVALWLAFRKR